MTKSPVKFLKEVQTELNQVTWPTRKEVIRLTGAVVLISLIVGAYIGALDLVFTKLVQLVIGG
jgi:preprotein translocase subunit SecE